ncbi:BLUF domain-containing protein [Aureimonas glaciei]|uniref:BLUF domain-containing protein n=1 Tax=Aureimonas glaciei TaxID=1776957 RepID=A0A917DHK5_9HYPH|nr:BLUF domain-containing protein [Aureimonas glaciei]GGD38260.1 hypothetical protein GCM10011335_46220 [Aureimonas glaciei]
MLIRLRYASTLAPDTTMDDVGLIVERSSIWNLHYGITGVLAVDGGRVMQILEGPGETVDGLYENICRDSRHVGVVILDRNDVAGRHFAEWSMVRRSMAEMLIMSAD